MNIISISLRNMRIRALSTALTALSITLGTSLIAVLWLAMDAADEHYKASGRGFSAIVGPNEGAPLSLVLNTVLNLGSPPGVVPLSVYKELHDGPLSKQLGMRYVVPQGRGDSYLSYPIIGTTEEMFSKFRRGKDGPSLEFAAGKPFSFSHDDLLKFADEYAKRLQERRAGHDSRTGESTGGNHDHSNHDHSTHDHSTHDHKDHDGKDHDGKDHDHGHEGHGHEGQDHDAHDHGPPHVHVDTDHHAVIGAEVAKESGMRVGSTFVPTHGLADTVGAHIHAEDTMQVVGILETTHTPLDRSIFVPLSGFLGIEGHDPIQDNQKAEADSVQLSAIIVDTRHPTGPYKLRKIFQTRDDAQVAFTGVVLAELYRIVGGGQKLLQVVCWVVLAVGALLVLVALYNTMNERRREIAIMRSLGARRHQILRIILQEAAFVSLLGGVCGVLLCHAAVLFFADLVEQRTSVPLDWTAFSRWEVVLVLAVTLLGGISGILPAVKGSKTPVAENLGPTS